MEDGAQLLKHAGVGLAAQGLEHRIDGELRELVLETQDQAVEQQATGLDRFLPITGALVLEVGEQVLQQPAEQLVLALDQELLAEAG